MLRQKMESTKSGAGHHLTIFLALLLLLSLNYALDAPECNQNLSVANSTYTMNMSKTANGTNCYNVTAANITLDCAGYSITGNNSTGTYGFYTNQANTTLRNCKISNFGRAAYWNGASNGVIVNNSLNTTFNGDYAMLMDGTNANHLVANNSISAMLGGAGGLGALRLITTTNSLIIGNIMNATSGYAMIIGGGVTGTLMTNNTLEATTATQYGFYWANTIGGNFTGNLIRSNFGGATFDGTAVGRSFTNNTIIAKTGIGINYLSGTNGNLSFNNITMTTGTGIVLSVTSLNSINTVVEGNTVTTVSGVPYQCGSIAGTPCIGTLVQNNEFTISNGGNYILYIGGGTTGERYLNNTISNGNGACLGANLVAMLNATFANNRIFCNNSGTDSGALWFNGAGATLSVSNSTFANNTLEVRTVSPTSQPIRFRATGGTIMKGNTFVNNTLINSFTSGLVYINPLSGNNLFYWNNFTATTGYYVNDTNGTNRYNTTINGTAEGNWWFNAYTNNTLQSLPWLHSNYCLLCGIINYPIGYAYNNSTSNKVFGNVNDYAPLTMNTSNGAIFLIRIITSQDMDFTFYNSFSRTIQFGFIPANLGISCSINATSTDGFYKYSYNTTNVTYTNTTQSISLSGIAYNKTYNYWFECVGSGGLFANTSTWQISILPSQAVPTDTVTKGDLNMEGLIIFLGIAWIVFWATALWFYETKRNLFAYCAYLAGFFALFTNIFVAIDATAESNPATAQFLQMFVFPMTWILVASVVGLVLYVFVGTLVKMGQTFGIKIQNWWYDGKI